MSEATPRPPSAHHPTRQQLDELEALMQRMLALPVNQLDDDPGPLATAVPVLPELERMPAELALAEDENPWQLTAPPVEPEPAESPRADLKGVSYRLTVVHEPATPSEKSVSAPALRPPPQRKSARLPGAFRHRGSRSLRVLLSINRAFDRSVGHLGPIGRWLRGRHGRAWLGWMGLALLGTALVLAILDLIGWTW